MKSLAERTKIVILEQLGLADHTSLGPDTRFVEDLGAVSLDVLELAIAIEDEFGLEEISDEEIAKATTVGGLLNYVYAHVPDSQRHPGDYLSNSLYPFTPFQPVSQPTQEKEPAMSGTLAQINLSNFVYKKKDGSAATPRQVVVINETPDRVLALEVKGGDLTPVQPYLAFAAELAEMELHLKAKYGLDKTPLPYKSFLVDGISARSDMSISINL